MIDLSIIIISYNTSDFLKQCLDSVFASETKFTYEVIVVDNDSKDNSVAIVKKNFPKVHLFVNKENFGFSKANNIGVSKAKGRYLLFLNSDTKIGKDTLGTMVRFMDENKDAGAATPKLELPDGKIDDASHRGFPTPWNSFTYFSGLAKIFPSSMTFNGYNLAFKNLNETHEVDAVAGAFMIVRREAGDQLGWWDEDYFFYGEDLDFCYMLKQKGWNIYYVSTTTVLHYKGVSSGIKKVSQDISPATTETKKRVTLERFRAMRLFYKKHYLKKYPRIISAVTMFSIYLREKISLAALSK